MPASAPPERQYLPHHDLRGGGDRHRQDRARDPHERARRGVDARIPASTATSPLRRREVAEPLGRAHARRDAGATRHAVAGGAGGSSFLQQVPHEVAPRIPMLPQDGHSRSSGAGPSSRNSTRSAHDASNAVVSAPPTFPAARWRRISRSRASTMGRRPSACVMVHPFLSRVDAGEAVQRRGVEARRGWTDDRAGRHEAARPTNRCARATAAAHEVAGTLGRCDSARCGFIPLWTPSRPRTVNWRGRTPTTGSPLDRPRTLLLVLSPASVASRWVQFELDNFLRDRHLDEVIPLVKASCAQRQPVQRRVPHRQLPSGEPVEQPTEERHGHGTRLRSRCRQTACPSTSVGSTLLPRHDGVRPWARTTWRS